MNVRKTRIFDDLKRFWINPQDRKRLIDMLPDNGRGVRLLQELLNRKEYDLYDILAEIGFGIAPKSRRERADALKYKHDSWFNNLPKKAADTLFALARQFEKGGTEELENPHVFNAPDVVKAGGLEVLTPLGKPKDIITETRKRLFSA